MKKYIEEPTLFGHNDVIGFGDNDFYVKEINKKLSKEIIIKNHYSKKCCNDATTHIHLGIFMNNELVGVLQYGYAMNPQSMNKIVKGTKLHEYKELNRMWLDDKAPKNSESKSISCIKYIKRKYPNVKWIQSFADERCGKFGIVYQAANFQYFGEHTSTFWIIDDEIFHNSALTNNNRNKKKQLEAKYNLDVDAEKIELRQFRYIYFIDKRLKKDCLFIEKDFEKHYNKI